MSRRVNGLEGEPVSVETDAENRPLAVDGETVLRHLSYHREWVGILNGEPQVDVWKVETPGGICELHCRSYPRETALVRTESAADRPGVWVLMRWED